MTLEPPEALPSKKSEFDAVKKELSIKPKSRYKPYVLVFSRLFVIILVVIWIGKTFREAGNQFDSLQFSFSEFDLIYLVLAAMSYLLGLLCFGMFWHLGLCAMGQRPTVAESLKSYALSQLGKYVPGKALVVIIRSDLVSSERVERSVAVVGVFVETLGMMAVGGSLASIVLFIGYGSAHESGWLALFAFALAVGSTVGGSPPMFRFVIRILSKRRGLSMLDKAIDGLSWRFLAKGWLIAAVGWLFLGTSMILVLLALPLNQAEMTVEALDYPLICAAVALSMVAGFLSLLPGGAGVREIVISSLLSPLVGPVFAMISAISLRVVWLLCELGATGGFLIRNRKVKYSVSNESTNSGV